LFAKWSAQPFNSMPEGATPTIGVISNWMPAGYLY
jgi:hypothetical protein